MAFLAFAEDWNDRWNADIDNPPDPAEFDAYSDLLQPNVWSLVATDGATYSLDNAPTFVGNKEISWKTI
jgi:hypothetical protein